MIDSIQNIDDVITFSKDLINEGCNFHPDEDFHNYINLETNEPSYNFQQAESRNNLMSRSFQICSANNTDIYDLTMEVFLKETNLSEFIPLPSKGFE